MTRVLIGNDFAEDLRDDRGWAGWWVQRLAWFARDDDVLVLPTAPDQDFIRYVTALSGVDPDSLTFVVPPTGPETSALLTGERVRAPAVIDAIFKALAGREVSRIRPLWPDAAVADLARSLGASEALEGEGFIRQDGGRLVNSKSVFRALAAGAGVPIADGAVCSSRERAAREITALLDRGADVIVKQDYLSGGHGNEILSGDSFSPIGARRVVTVASAAEVASYLDERWAVLSGADTNRVVVEEYHRDSRAYFAEFRLTDDGSVLDGTGEMLSAPFAIGQIMPANLPSGLLDDVIDHGQKLAEVVHLGGFRGWLSADAIVTPRSRVLFSEFNGRVTGSTHIYREIGRQVVGPGFGQDRMILERVWPSSWSVGSFADALRKATAAGAAFDPEARAGLVFTNAFDAKFGGVMYCIVAESVEEAWRRDRALHAVFGR